MARVEQTCDPSVLANFVFDLAKRFSRFYQECPVLKAEPGLRLARLKLVTCAESIMTTALDVLGIQTVDTM